MAGDHARWGSLIRKAQIARTSSQRHWSRDRVLYLDGVTQPTEISEKDDTPINRLYRLWHDLQRGRFFALGRVGWRLNDL